MREPNLSEMLPPPETLLELEPEDIASILLEYLQRLPDRSGSFQRNNLTNADSYHSYAGEKARSVGRAISEALGWLEHEGLVAAEAGEHLRVVVSRRGRKIRTRTDFDAFKHARLLPSGLDPTLAGKVRATFTRGDYEQAVFQAFKEVEVRVREVASLPTSLVGVSLMRAAFHPDSGPMTDMSLDKAERQATMELFSGAMGVFRNPTGHRRVDFTPGEAAELIAFANQLLRMVEERRSGTSSSGGAGPTATS